MRDAGDLAGTVADELRRVDLEQAVVVAVAAVDDAGAVRREERAAVVAGGIDDLLAFAGGHVQHPEIALRLGVHLGVEERAAVGAQAALGGVAVAVAHERLQRLRGAVGGAEVTLHHAHLGRELPAILARAALVAGRLAVGGRHHGAAEDDDLRVLGVEPAAGVRAALGADALDVRDARDHAALADHVGHVHGIKLAGRAAVGGLLDGLEDDLAVVRAEVVLAGLHEAVGERELDVVREDRGLGGAEVGGLGGGGGGRRRVRRRAGRRDRGIGRLLRSAGSEGEHGDRSEDQSESVHPESVGRPAARAHGEGPWRAPVHPHRVCSAHALPRLHGHP